MRPMPLALLDALATGGATLDEFLYMQNLWYARQVTTAALREHLLACVELAAAQLEPTRCRALRDQIRAAEAGDRDV